VIPFYKLTSIAASAWSRRRFFLNMGKLFLAGFLLPAQSASAQLQLGLPLSQKEILRVFVDALLPADELTPAASTLDIHQLILDEAKGNLALQPLIDEGCLWLQQSFGALTALDSQQLERLLQAMDNADWDTGPKNFFYHIRDRAVYHYYANPRAWAGSAISRSPQPLGYPEAINK